MSKHLSKKVPIKDYKSELENESNWYDELHPNKQKLIDQLAVIGEVKYVRSEIYIQEQIVNAISEMNIDALKIHLENLSSFEDKNEFLAEISLKFKKFKENKDTYLTPYSGKCSGVGCDNFGNKGKSFTGNVSNTFFNVVVEKENNECVGICTCYKFDVDDKVLNKTRLEAHIKKINAYNFTDSELDDLPF